MEGSGTGVCPDGSTTDPRRAAIPAPRGPRTSRGVALLPRQDRDVIRARAPRRRTHREDAPA